jgi:hypothetical protein
VYVQQPQGKRRSSSCYGAGASNDGDEGWLFEPHRATSQLAENPALREIVKKFLPFFESPRKANDVMSHVFRNSSTAISAFYDVT